MNLIFSKLGFGAIKVKAQKEQKQVNSDDKASCGSLVVGVIVGAVEELSIVGVLLEWLAGCVR